MDTSKLNKTTSCASDSVSMFLILGIIPINVSTSLSIVFASNATFGMINIVKEI